MANYYSLPLDHPRCVDFLQNHEGGSALVERAGLSHCCLNETPQELRESLVITARGIYWPTSSAG